MILHAVVIRTLTAHPYRAGMKLARYLPDQIRYHQVRSAMICFGESHEGCAGSYQDYITRSVLMVLLMDGSIDGCFIF